MSINEAYGAVQYGGLTPEEEAELEELNAERSALSEIIYSGPVPWGAGWDATSSEYKAQFDMLYAQRKDIDSRIRELRAKKYRTQLIVGTIISAAAAGISYQRNGSILKSIGAYIFSLPYLAYVGYDTFTKRQK
jgi:hypothetical protein